MKCFHIVLVEDNPGDVFLVEEALRAVGLGYRITRYPDGDEALAELARSDQEAPDLLLIDLNLPKVDGFELLSAIRHMPALQQTPLAVFSSSQSPKDRERCRALGATYIEKPSTFEEFLTRVGPGVLALLGLPAVNGAA